MKDKKKHSKQDDYGYRQDKSVIVLIFISLLIGYYIHTPDTIIDTVIVERNTTLPPVTKTIEKIVEKECPVCEKAACPQVDCQECRICPSYIHGITNPEYMEFKAMAATNAGTCYQSGFQHCKKRVYKIFKLTK